MPVLTWTKVSRFWQWQKHILRGKSLRTGQACSDASHEYFSCPTVLALGIPAPGVSVICSSQQMTCCPHKCLPPVAGISPAYLLIVLENHKYACTGEDDEVRLFVPIWLLNRKKVTLGLSGSSFNFISLQIKSLCLSALGINPTWQIPVRSHDWPVTSKAVVTISLDLTTGEMGALSPLEW